MVELRNVSYTIGQKSLVKEINLSFEKEAMNMILGPNGAGKTTALKLASGLMPPSDGQVLLNERDVSKMDVISLAKIRAVLSQQMDLVFPLKVHEVIMMGRYPHFERAPRAVDLQLCDEVMTYFELNEFKDREYMTLSGGEKQRVHFARILAQIGMENCKAKLLFLDEPLTYLDIRHQVDFMRKLRKLVDEKGLTVVGILHDLNLALKFADYVTLMCKGSVVFHGTLADALNESLLSEVFDIKVRLTQVEGKPIVVVD